MSNFAVYLIILLVVAAIVVFLCIYAYNKRLDKVTSGEVRDTHSTIPEPGTAVGTIYRIVLILIVIMLFFSLSTANGKLTAMQNDIDSLERSVSSLSNQVYDLEQKLSENGKRVGNTNVEVLDPDYEARTAEVRFSADLKEYTEGMEVVLNLNGRKVELKEAAPGTYSGQFTAGFFEEFADPRLSMNDHGRICSEEVDFPEYLFWNFIPVPNLECKLESDVSASGKLKYEGWYRILVDHPQDIESVSVTYVTNGGREIRRMDMTKEVLERQEITLEDGMDPEKYLALRIELITKQGIKVEDQQVIIFEASPEYEGVDYLRILDLQGNLLWEDPYRS